MNEPSANLQATARLIRDRLRGQRMSLADAKEVALIGELAWCAARRHVLMLPKGAT